MKSQNSAAWEENTCFKINVLPRKIINHYIPDSHNKTQASKGEKVTDFKTTVFVVLVPDTSKQIYWEEKKKNLYLKGNNCFF